MALMTPPRRPYPNARRPYPNARSKEAQTEYDFQPNSVQPKPPSQSELSASLSARQAASVRPRAGLMGAARFGVSNAQNVGPQQTTPRSTLQKDLPPREAPPGNGAPIDFAPGTRMTQMPGGYWQPTATGGRDISEFVLVPNANGQGGNYMPRDQLPANWRPGMGVGRTGMDGEAPYEAQEYQDGAVFPYMDHDYGTGGRIAGDRSQGGTAPPATPPSGGGGGGGGVAQGATAAPRPNVPTPNVQAQNTTATNPVSPQVIQPNPNPPSTNPGFPTPGAPPVNLGNQTPVSNLYKTLEGSPGVPGNTTPGSTPGANPNVDWVPGMTGTIGQQRNDDLHNRFLEALNARNRIELGGMDGPGGNNLRSDGTYSQPDYLSDSGIMGSYNGANTSANTRGVDPNETVEERLARLSRGDSELNRIAIENAQEQAAAGGMIGGSTAAAGAALRASREAMLPVAQQDAATYAQTARDNMDARNRDALSDQELRSGLLGQSMGIKANLYEAASDRRWRSKEANHERMYKTMENNLSWLRASSDREDNQEFAWMNREDEQHWNAWQSDLVRGFEASMQDDRQQFEGTQAERTNMQQRQMAYFEMTFGREGMFANTMASIYSNPNLTPDQQQAAARGAGDFFRQMWESFNATLGAGIPEIFTNPYPMNPGTGTPPATGNPPPTGNPTQPPTGSPTTPPATNPPGPGTGVSPIIGYDDNGNPIYGPPPSNPNWPNPPP